MIFSERQRLAQEYQKWLPEGAENGPFNVITFLSSKGLLVDKTAIQCKGCPDYRHGGIPCDCPAMDNGPDELDHAEVKRERARDDLLTGDA
jgi:hypothetical protein